MKGNKSFGKYFGRVVHPDLLTTDEIAEEIQKSATVKRSDVRAVLSELGDVMGSLLREGYKVHINGLGTFKVATHSSGVDTPQEFKASHLHGWRINFQPDYTIVKSSVKSVDGKIISTSHKQVALIDSGVSAQRAGRWARDKRGNADPDDPGTGTEGSDTGGSGTAGGSGTDSDDGKSLNP